MARMQIHHLRHGLVAQASVGPCLMPRRSRGSVFAIASLVCLHSKRGIQFNPGHVFARDSALDFPFAPASVLPRSLITGKPGQRSLEAEGWTTEVHHDKPVMISWFSLRSHLRLQTHACMHACKQLSRRKQMNGALQQPYYPCLGAQHWTYTLHSRDLRLAASTFQGRGLRTRSRQGSRVLLREAWRSPYRRPAAICSRSPQNYLRSC